MPANSRDKENYKRLRALSWRELWLEEVPGFNRSSPAERRANVALVRALAVVFAETDDSGDVAPVRSWFIELLGDPEEKIRRYAIAALPKLGASAESENALLEMLRREPSPREKESLLEALAKIGGETSLKELSEIKTLADIEQKIRATMTREGTQSNLERTVVPGSSSEIHLHTRGGLETILSDEVAGIRRFKVGAVHTGLVVLKPRAPYSLNDLLQFRCYDSFGISLGFARENSATAMAALIAESAPLLRSLTKGPVSYRISFPTKGHQRAVVQRIADQVYARSRDLLNSPSRALWTISIRPTPKGHLIEAMPRLDPDPRFAYRLGDVPAASHPPLAAAMARLAGREESDVIWDPFCGSGLELVERSLAGGVKQIYGTDLNSEAIEITRRHLKAANLDSIPSDLTVGDFRKTSPSRVSLVITNPPLGRRVPIPNLPGLLQELFEISSKILTPGGRLVLVNPFKMPPHPKFRREFHRKIDLGGFHAYLERYRKG